MEGGSVALVGQGALHQELQNKKYQLAQESVRFRIDMHAKTLGQVL